MSRSWSIRALIWRCGPQDEAQDALGDALVGVCGELALGNLEPLDPTRQERQPEAGLADVLLVVGAPAPLARALALEGEAQGPLLRTLQELPLVVLLCPAGVEAEAGARLGQALCARGASAALVLGQANPPRVRALLRALVAGESLAWGVAELRGGGAASLAVAGAADRPLCAPRWAPEGCGAAAADCAQLLHKAWLFARARGCRYVGVEQVGEALLRRGAAGQAASSLRARLLARGSRLPRPWRELQPLPWAPPDWRGTPRLRRLLAGVEQGLEPWLRALLVEARNPVAWAAGVPLDPGGPATGLEVWAGPDDGQPLALEPGAWLGRWVEPGAPPTALYHDAPFTDPRLSPRALRWLGGGVVELPRTCALTRAGARELVGPGEVLLRGGDLLELSRGSWVMGG